MSTSQRRAGMALSALFLASTLFASLVASASAAVTTTNADPKVTVPTGIATPVGINYVWSGTATDALAAGTTYAVTIPAGYAWSAQPSFGWSGASLAFSSAVTSNSNLTLTWTLTSFSASVPWTLNLSGGTISTTNVSGTGSVTLSVNGGSATEIAGLTASGTQTGSLIPVTISPKSVPADGASTITIAFGTVSAAATCTTDSSFTVSTTAGTFTQTNLPGVSIPAGGTNAVAVVCGNYGAVNGTTLTLKAPTTPGSATITVVRALAGGGTLADSTTQVQFTGPNTGAGQGGQGKGGQGEDHGNGNGARKLAFFAAGSLSTCAAAAAQPATGAKSFGFAVVNTTGNGKLNVTVSLKGATPNSTFNVAVDQGGTCSASFPVTTNASGNGTGHKSFSLVKGATSFWVSAWNGSAAYETRAATLNVKGHGHGKPAAKDNPGKGHGNGHGQGNGNGQGKEND